jgi:hypothetical protein
LDNLTITGGANIDTVDLTGATGDNIEVDGGAGDDTLTGSNSGDEISGGAGNDDITGGDGADTLSGGAGNDNFVYTADDDISADSAAGDQITDFVAADDAFQFQFFGATGNGNANAFNDALAGSGFNVLEGGLSGASAVTALSFTSIDANTTGSTNDLTGAGVTAIYEFSGADLASAIEAFQGFLTGLDADTGAATTAFAVYAELDAGGDTHLAIAFVADQASSSPITAGDIDFRVIDVDNEDFTISDIEFLASA